MALTGRRLRRHWRLAATGLVIVFFLLMAFLPEVFAPRSPTVFDTARRLEGPSRDFPFGTDDLGRDILSRIIHGARASLIIAFGAVGIAVVGGVTLGMVGGYYRGLWEWLPMRLVDVMLCFPPIVLAILIVGFLGPGMANLVMVIGVLYVSRMARVVHGATLSIRDSDYVEAHRAVGAAGARILLRGILPNIMAPVIVQATLMLGTAILVESGLSFLGLGVPPPAPSWGDMIGRGRTFMLNSPTGVIFPSVTLMVVVLAFNLFGDALRDHLDPRLRGAR
ncbi:MAG: ABC transporter permease [Armatimonadota bacterium]|nr:ABC transporter permease [Armatimonadota bacterium]